MSEATIRLLLARLVWPSLLVRERAASELVKLLRDPAVRETVADQFLGWIASLKFESLAANALLIPLRLKREGFDVLPSPESLVAALNCPSLLSEAIFSVLGAKTSTSTSSLHSGRPQATFEVDSYFNTYVKSFVPPAYDHHARRLEERSGIPFRRQWAYEWSMVRQRTGLGYSEPPHYFLHPRAHTGNVYFDTLQSEAFRSSFLRALAWAIDDQKVDAGTELLTLTCCPLDMALWGVVGSPVPDWWPRVTVKDTGIDTAAAEVLQAVRTLWQRGCENPTMRLAFAAGRVATGADVVYALEIRAAFQSFLGGREPELSEVGEFLRDDVSLSTLPPGLATEGCVEPISPSNNTVRIQGWGLIRTVFRLDPWVVPRWQAPRMFYGCLILAPYLGSESVAIASRPDAVVLKIHDNVVCETYFWHDFLREADVRGVPPRSGVYMLADNKLIQDFSDRNNASFCWLVTLNVYHREGFGEFKCSPAYYFLGSSNIIRPLQESV